MGRWRKLEQYWRKSYPTVETTHAKYSGFTKRAMEKTAGTSMINGEMVEDTAVIGRNYSPRFDWKGLCEAPTYMALNALEGCNGGPVKASHPSCTQGN